MIPASELADMRTTATSALDIPGVQIQHATRTDLGNGLQSPVWNTTATVSASQAKPSAKIMALYADVIGSATSMVMRLPYGTSYTADDRILMPSGDIWRIQDDLSDSSYSTCQLLLVAKVQPA